MISVLAKPWIVSLSFIISIICIFIIQILSHEVPLTLSIATVILNIMGTFNSWVQAIHSLPSPSTGTSSSKTPFSFFRFIKLIKAFFY